MSTTTVAFPDDDDEPAIVEAVSREVIPAPVPALAVTPQVKAVELVERLNVIRDAMDNAMQEDVDYGRIPGTDKPALLKPGAEKLGVLFQLDIQPETRKTWGPGDHLTVECTATVFHAPTGSRLGRGEGLCTTREKKYARRRADRVCPQCGQAAIIKGKQEYGGGWVCFRKKGGCGAKWSDGAQEIESQQTGEVDNPELPDLWNTVIKMAEKRARVDAVLAVTGASALFTQDEDQAPAPQEAAPVEATPAPAPARAPEMDAVKADPPELPLILEGVAMLLKAGVWKRQEMKMHLVAAGATNTASVRRAVLSMSAAQVTAFASRVCDLAGAIEQTGGES